MKNLIKLLPILIVIISFGCSKKQNDISCTDCNQNGVVREAVKKQNAWKKLNSEVVNLYGQKDYKKAIKAGKEALKFAEKSFNKEHPYVATSLNNLAEIYRVQGKFSDAESLFKRALQIREKVLGKDDIDVALTLNNFAALYFQEKKYDIAENYYKRSLKILESKLGRDNPQLEATLANIAELYKQKGRYKEAGEFFNRVLAIKEQAENGTQDPLYAKYINDLATVYFLQGEYSKAKPLFQKTLTLLEKAFGKDHPQIAVVLDNLIEVHKKLGNVEEIKKLTERVNQVRIASQFSK